MNEAEALTDFVQFWQTHFPERGNREQFLRDINDRSEGLYSTKPDTEMSGYQNKVAVSYGIYEEEQHQRDTLARLWQCIFSAGVISGATHLVSLGCGPASYELWLLSRGLVGRVTLVDHSVVMLQRAQDIADKLNLSDRVVTVVADAAKNGLADSCGDMVFCINAMHWSEHWRRWVREAGRIAKPQASIFLSCTLKHPRSRIETPDLGEIARSVFSVKSFNMIQDVAAMAKLDPSTMVALSFRFFVFGRRNKVTSNQAGKKNKKNKKR
ncbi:MAG: class I SAM-dependent methyltransferase [Patescibacteria group bacterium]